MSSQKPAQSIPSSSQY